jgi:hypothetical protein
LEKHKKIYNENKILVHGKRLGKDSLFSIMVYVLKEIAIWEVVRV